MSGTNTSHTLKNALLRQRKTPQMSDYILPLTIAIIGSGAFSAVVSAVISAITNRKKKQTSTTLGLMVLLEDRIDFLATCYIKQGFIVLADKDRIHRMWHVYHNVLGGNGYLDEKMGLVDELPVHLK